MSHARYDFKGQKEIMRVIAKEYNPKLDIDFDMIYDWYDSVDKMVKRNLDTSLNKLEKMGLIGE